MNNNIDEKLEMEWDIIVFSTSHSEYKNPEILEKLSKMSGIMIYDTVGLLNNSDIIKLNKKNKVKVLGRGDI